MNYVLTSARALAAGAAIALAGAPAAVEPLTLTWADVVRLVGEHPRVREADARSAAAAAGVSAAGAIPNPSLDVAIARGTPRDRPGEAKLEQAYELSLPLEWLAQRGPRLDAARATLDEAKAEARALRRDALSQLGALFWNAAFDQARVESLQLLDAQAFQVAKLVGLRVEKGEARPIELPRAETEAERVRNELAAARSQLQSRRGQLELWIAGLEQSPWRVDPGALEALPRVPELETALAALREGHPSLQALRARLRALDAEVVAERRQRLPAFSAKVFFASELDRQSAGGGVGVSLPLWDWRSGRIEQAEAARRAEAYRLEAKARELLSSAVESRDSCAQAQQAAARHREQILPRAEKVASMLERSFQIGETALLDVLDSRRVLGEARREYLAVLLQTQLECLRLRLLLGETP